MPESGSVVADAVVEDPVLAELCCRRVARRRAALITALYSYSYGERTCSAE
ncbi:hypothetical protein [Streptomyces ziwulingensis]|uniref:hypothetical protein n=1 Tax=Streptomyces ziwulingensis TaxID=1045501 RepID=UPI0031EEECAB